MGKQADSPDRLVIDGLSRQVPGRHRNRRYLKFRIFIGKGKCIRELWLSPTGFRLLGILALHLRCQVDDGWVAGARLVGLKDSRGTERQRSLRAAQYIYKLRQELSGDGHFSEWNPIANEKGTTRYRINMPMSALVINSDGLRGFGDSVLSAMVEKLVPIRDYPVPRIITYLIQGNTRRELISEVICSSSASGTPQSPSG